MMFLLIIFAFHSQQAIKKLNKSISNKLVSESRLTASARNSNSNNRKSTGWYYLKSRAFSTVRKPWVHGIWKVRLVVLFQRRESPRTAVRGTVKKHQHGLNRTLLHQQQRKVCHYSKCKFTGTLSDVVLLLRLFSPGLVCAFPQSENNDHWILLSLGQG